MGEKQGGLGEAANDNVRASESHCVIHVHGIGNKPPAPVLECQWNAALFGAAPAAETRLAYWVDRARYRVPLTTDCTAADDAAIDDLDIVALAGEADGKAAIEAEIMSLAADPMARGVLRALSERLLDEAREPPLPVRPNVLPLPGFARRRLTWLTTRLFLRDVNDFFFRPERRASMLESLRVALRGAPGPSIIVAHSQGSMIAYEVLRTLEAGAAEVPLLVTIGSPLGLLEVQDVMRGWSGTSRFDRLPFPASLGRWVNVADRLDPVAFDTRLANDFTGAIEDHTGFGINLDAPYSPHSATGYLRNPVVRAAVLEALDRPAQPLDGGVSDEKSMSS